MSNVEGVGRKKCLLSEIKKCDSNAKTELGLCHRHEDMFHFIMWWTANVLPQVQANADSDTPLSDAVKLWTPKKK